MFSRIQRWFGNGWQGIAELLITAFCVFLALSVHEVAHGFVAYLLGDETAKNSGRLSLSPRNHIDPIGAICLFFFGFGWANPVPVNPRNFHKVKMKTGMVITSLAGPLSNILLAFVSLFLIKIISLSNSLNVAIDVLAILLSVSVTLNVSLAVFNLLPVPPLDGYKILSAVLPPRYYFKLMEYERFGFIILLLVIYLPIFNTLLRGAANGIINLMFMLLNLLPF